MKRLLASMALAILMIAMVAVPASASVGIGMSCGCSGFNLGTIERGSYHVGQVCILNTGTDASWYKMGVAYVSQQVEYQIPADWVSFSIDRFYLEPGVDMQFPFDIAQKVVQVELNIPPDAIGGDYFAYLEAASCSDGDGVSIGVAVGSRLRFTVVGLPEPAPIPTPELIEPIIIPTLEPPPEPNLEIIAPTPEPTPFVSPLDNGRATPKKRLFPKVHVYMV